MIPEVKKILYATDLSKNARYAFAYAAGIANRYGAKVTILHVMEDLSPSAQAQVTIYLGDKEWKEIRTKNLQQAIDTIKERLTNFCTEVAGELPECPFITDDILVKTGHPVEVILNMAHSEDFDMVVMGTHGHSMLADAMMGSVARRVTRRCKKPVLVVHLPEE